MENIIEKNNKTNYIIIILAILLLAIGGYFGYKYLGSSKPEEKKSEKKEEVKSNITPLLYEVTKEGSNNKMYLLGSIHAANKEDLVFPEYVMNAYNSSHYLACEFDNIAYLNDQEKVMASALKMLYQDGTTIKDHLNEKTYNKLIDFLQKKNSYVNVYEQYKPYFFISLLTEIMTKETNIASSGIDEFFLNKAHEDNKKILEVESYDYQISVFESFPDEFYDLMINEEIDNYNESIEELKKMYEAWKTGNIEDLLKYGSEDLDIKETYTKKQKEYIELFNKKIIYDRNDTMTKKAIEYFDDGKDVFFMVGALHIVGDNGIANKLKTMGYNVEIKK